MSLQNQPDDHLSPIKPNITETEERYDTLIGVILAFGMAIGTWAYAVKPWQDSYLKLSSEAEKPMLAPTAQPIHEPTESLEKNITYHPEAEVSAPATPLVNPFAAPAPPAPNLTVDTQTQQPIVVTVPELHKPIVVVLEPPLNKTAAPTLPIAPAPVAPIVAQAPIATPTVAPVPVTPVATPAPTIAPPVAAPPIAQSTPIPVVVPATPPPIVAPEPPLPANVVIRESIEFAMGKASVPESAKARLLEVAEMLKNDTRQLKIVGHTDSIGFTGANRRLSLRRANAIKAFLVAAGVNAEHLKAEGLGESQPIADNQTIEGRDRNRRIEIVL